MQGDAACTGPVSQEIIEINRDFNVNGYGSSTGPIALSTATNGGKQKSDQGEVVRDDCMPEQGSQGGNFMVDSIFGNIEREIVIEEYEGSRNNQRCIQLRMGSMEGEPGNRRKMEGRGESMAYKCEGAEGGHYGDQGVHEIDQECADISTYGQHHGGFPDKQTVQSSIESYVVFGAGNVGVLRKEEPSSDGNIPTGGEERSSRLVIPEVRRYERLEGGSSDFSSHREQAGEDGNRSLCVKNEHSETEVYQLEAGSRGRGSGLLPDRLERGEGICVPAVLSDRTGAQENSSGQSYDHTYSTYLGKSSMVSDFAADASTGATANSSFSGNVAQQLGQDASHGGDEFPTVSGMEGFRMQAKAEGFSDETTELLASKWRPGTKISYKYSWEKWGSWARGRGINPFRATVVNIVEFLNVMFRKGLSYSTINGYRSAISALHPHIERKPVGEHPRVMQAMNAIFNLRPPEPRYSSQWDVNKVLVSIRAMGDNDNILLRDLGAKLAMLIALSAAKRSSDLTLLDTSLMADLGDKVVFHIKGLSKTRKVGQNPLA